MASSLIQKEQAELEMAPYLFSENELPPIDKTKPKFHCTGERLFRDRREIYDACVQMLAEPGCTIRSICATLHMTDDTVRAVKEREGISIAAQKKTVLSNITHGLRLASERVIELMPEASTRDALIGVGILGEKMQLLSEGATQRIDITSHVNIQEEMKKLYDKINERFSAAKQANVIEVHTGIGGENSPAKALADPEPVFVNEEVRQLNETGLVRLEAVKRDNVTKTRSELATLRTRMDSGAKNPSQNALNGATADDAPAAPESPRGEASALQQEACA
jgi:hypothetical protein